MRDELKRYEEKLAKVTLNAYKVERFRTISDLDIVAMLGNLSSTQCEELLEIRHETIAADASLHM